MNSKRIYFFTPSFQPCGGVIKIFDYVNHALALDYEVIICCPKRYSEDLPLFQIPKFQNISPHKGLKFTVPEQVSIEPGELVFFSWPRDYMVIEKRLSSCSHLEQVVHIIQSVRHANPSFTGGYATRLLSRPMARIVISDIVSDAIKPFLNSSSLAKVVPLGHDTSFFHQQKYDFPNSVFKIAYTTWKSDIGDQIAKHFIDQKQLQFKAIRNKVSWVELRELYQWADIFLATPYEEEGFYLAGLEAMAAGAIVLSPDAIGNRAYCKFGENCLYVELENVESYISTIKSLLQKPAEYINQLRQRGYETVQNHDISVERKLFKSFLEKVT